MHFAKKYLEYQASLSVSAESNVLSVWELDWSLPDLDDKLLLFPVGVGAISGSRDQHT